LKHFLKVYGGQKSAAMLAEDYVSKNQSEAILSYLGIFQSLADEFKDRRFVLLFDKFEFTKKASVNFLINFVNRMPDKFHIVISFRTEGEEETGNVSSDSVSIELYQFARGNLIEAGSKPLRLLGLSEKDIGLWIKIVTGIQLPLTPELKRIKENSAGSPLNCSIVCFSSVVGVDRILF
jgi:hypothetical protein